MSLFHCFRTAQCFLVFLTVLTNLAVAALPPWSYDAGPDPKSKLGRELIDIRASIPSFPLVSEKVMGDQKFRPAFGPVEWRMLQEPNKVKILFIGQDATHIAEAAGRPATAGFGGRAQDLAKYFGVVEGAAFINTYAFTIKGQYGAFEVPYVYYKAEDEPSIRFGSFVDSKLWLMTHDASSPIAQWRNRLIDWIIRNNRDSVRLIVLFGGAARDAAATFVESKGGSVEARLSDQEMSKIQIPETELKFAGGNEEFPVLLDEKGRDLYADIIGRALDYSSVDDQKAAKEAVTEDVENAIEKMVFTKAGPHSNGLIHPAQLGGFNLAKMKIRGRVTLSLKGLPLSDGTTIDQDILVAQLPHPSALSRLEKNAASAQVAKALKAFEPYVVKGWKIEPDEGATNLFADGKPYVYSRTDIGPEYYDFGAPGVRMVPVSSASRMPKNPHVIVFGSREKARFDMAAINRMTNATPASKYSDEEMFITRPRSKELRHTFDPGPGEALAKLMKEELPLDDLMAPKDGMTFEKNGIAAYNVKSHPEVGDFGHYRGTFSKARVLILADPDGYDDLITARALTGERGQYLQGLMNDLGVEGDYLVLKTVPFGMDGADDEEWNTALGLTRSYREKLIQAVFEKSDVELILADGPFAASELSEMKNLGNIPVIAIERGTKKDHGMSAAVKQIAKLEGFKGSKFSGKIADIPRSHLSYYARLWEATSGDRVLNSQDKYRGLAFAVVVPAWAWQQKFVDDDAKDGIDTQKGIRELLEILRESGFPMPGEDIPEFLKRTGESALFFFRQPSRLFAFGFDLAS